MKLAVKIVAGVAALLLLAKGVQYAIDYLYRKYGRRYVSTGLDS